MARFFASPAAVTEPEYTGGLTVGTITTILNDTYYNAWPSVCRTSAGDLIVAYTKGISHAGNNNAQPDFKISTDEGTTWGVEDFAIDDPSLKITGMGVSLVSSGRLFMALSRNDEGTAGSGEAGVIYSDDDGATWSSWIDLPNAWTREAFAAGPVVEAPNGDLLVTIEGSDTTTAAANRSSHLLRSTDDGLTWGDETTLREYATDTRPYYETCLLVLDNDEILAIHRDADGDGTHYTQRSTDNGATWSTPVSGFAGHGQPHAIQGTSQTVVVVTRGNGGDGCVAFTSIDRGVTWGSEIVLDSSMYEMEYGCPVELAEGSYLVVYGYQPTSSTSNSDIKQVLVTEVVAP